MSTKKLWIGLISVVAISFSVIGYYGFEIYHEAPPIPERVVTPDGMVLFTGEDIHDGQNVWQSTGGQELGSIWGHGAYVAPDWSADWLHREAVFILDQLALDEFHKAYSEVTEENRAVLQTRLRHILRPSGFDASTRTLTLPALRAKAIESNTKYYSGLFMNDPQLNDVRKAYAMPVNSLNDNEKAVKMCAFFFWASWACVTERPGSKISYTNNWPYDELVGNVPTSQLILWTGFTVILLIAGIGVMVFYHAKNKGDEINAANLPAKDPLLGLEPTPSMSATLKYFWTVAALFMLQVILGTITAHYGVEGEGFYGIPLGKIIPYTVTRTWHLQLAIFWIATSWLATGLYIAPAVSGHEPRFQKAGVNFLFVALVVIVLGSMAGEWMGVMQKLGLENNFWFGHQGYEYVDLGRFWQLFLFVGLVLWLILTLRALLPALRKPQSDNKPLLVLFLISSVAIALFYGAGLMYGRQSNLSVVEYWRWWVVHLWVEGFFEVFATVVVAFLFVRMGLLEIKSATTNVIFSTIIFLSGGIIGTFHHLYFTGTPTAVLALGATFSALEVVPLIFMGFEAYHNLRLSKATQWVTAYKWPIYYFISVAFWNLVGAGIFGFLINPPIALYYMQGLNTTPLHGHAALFGVYGMLGIGLMLFVLKGLYSRNVWKEGMLKFSFWTMNIGLMLMILLSLLPLGFAQTVAVINDGYWYARSAEFMQQFYVLKWLRVIGDTVFFFGVIALGYFILGLKTGWSVKKGEFDLTHDKYPTNK